MNILTIINKLKDAKMLSGSEEGIKLFSDCFNKYGISLLLLKNEETFNEIVDILKTNNIGIQKQNSIYALRIFAVDLLEIENTINEFKSLDELDFLRAYPEKLAEPKNIHTIIKNIIKFQESNTIYKDENGYNLNLLLQTNEEVKTEVPVIEIEEPTDTLGVIKKYLQDKTLLDKIINEEKNPNEEPDTLIELQKVENKICEDYLVIIDDGWKIVINDQEVNTFQEVKDTIDLISKLNLPITYNDALLITLFYKTKLPFKDVENIIQNELKSEVA